MKSFAFALTLFLLIASISCSKDDDTENDRFTLLTTPTWVSDSLLVDGKDAGGPGQLLENFNGDAKFNEDGSGTFGEFTGTWRFSSNETQIVITTESLTFPLTCKIEELTTTSLKITTGLPDLINGGELKIRMTFNVK